jgi:hypothetical protein
MLALAARCVMADSGKADSDDIPTHIATSKMTVGYRLVTIGTTPSSFNCSYFAPRAVHRIQQRYLIIQG